MLWTSASVNDMLSIRKNDEKSVIAKGNVSINVVSSVSSDSEGYTVVDAEEGSDVKVGVSQ